MEIIVAVIGLQNGMISTDIYASVIFMAIATSMIAPTLLKRLLMSEHPNGQTRTGKTVRAKTGTKR